MKLNRFVRIEAKNIVKNITLSKSGGKSYHVSNSPEHPVLAICVYHKKDDFVCIPEFIKQCYSDYLIYLRKYGAGYCSIRRFMKRTFIVCHSS